MGRLFGLTDAQKAAIDAGASLDLYPTAGGKVWTLSKIVIPKTERSAGIGTSVMKAVVREADAEGVIVALTPSTDFGASSKARLVEFYKRFGFVENKGRNKDFSISEAMYRPPRRSLSALPKTGRIPMPTVRRAMKSLGRKVKACKITAESLRLGMEVEREHRDVTRGGMKKTAQIAAAHLCEAGPGYYRGLKALEKRLKKVRR